MASFSVRSPETPEEWSGYYALRWKILRAPWQQKQGSERDEHENTAVHRMVCDADGRILAVGRLHYLDATTAQIRFMAVVESWRHRGLGSLVLNSLEASACSTGRTQVILHARESSLSFYRKAGYQLVEKSHVLYSEIQHFKMRKVFAD